MSERCETCRFWVTDSISSAGPPKLQCDGYPGAEDGYVLGGECHRQPPAGVYGMIAECDGWPDNAAAVWPITLPLDWCGEWQPAPRHSASETSGMTINQLFCGERSYWNTTTLGKVCWITSGES